MMRYLRYAAAVVFALLAVASVGWWVRSYYWWDSTGARTVRLDSYYGSTWMTVSDRNWGALDWGAQPADDKEAVRFWRQGLLGLDYHRDKWGTVVAVPHWFLAASSLGLAALFTFKRTWRYSLRTILIATTLLAAILGLAVYAIQ
jgi:hypothetical protein